MEILKMKQVSVFYVTTCACFVGVSGLLIRKWHVTVECWRLLRDDKCGKWKWMCADNCFRLAIMAVTYFRGRSILLELEN